MKKIIKGKVYDTDTAKLLGADGGGDGFSSWSEELYQKRTGEFFIEGEGGPATKYAVSCGQNQWRGGTKIIPLSAQAAREWAEEHLDADDYEAIFGIPDEDVGVGTLCIQVSEDVLAATKLRAAEDGKTLRAIVTEALTAYLKS